ncbi:MAG: dTMP kinase [Planctomycetota bacterium]
MSRGRFIVFEGPDGSGKSTQAGRLTAALEGRGAAVLMTREPGGTPIGEKVRELLLDARNTAMDRRTELLLYMASRAQLVAEILQPALDAGRLVVCDRYVYSSLVYQGYAGGLDQEEIARIGAFATAGLVPDLVLVVDVDPATGLRRRGRVLDRMEQQSLTFHARVREGFLGLAARDPGRFRVVDGSAAADAVFARVMTEVGRVL